MLSAKVTSGKSSPEKDGKQKWAEIMIMVFWWEIMTIMIVLVFGAIFVGDWYEVQEHTCRIIFLFSHADNFDLSVNDVKCMSLASIDQPDTLRSSMGQFEIQLFGQDCIWVTHELNNGISGNPLVFAPGGHDGSVIDTVHNDFVYTELFECVLFGQVSLMEEVNHTNEQWVPQQVRGQNWWNQWKGIRQSLLTGTWRVDHVGVNAPGKPMMITFFPAMRWLRFTFSGGKPKCRSMSVGILSPTFTACAPKSMADRNATIFMIFLFFESSSRVLLWIEVNQQE